MVVVHTTTEPRQTERAFLSLKQAASEISCTRRFLEKRIEDGELKVFRPSRRLVRVARGELNRWIESYSHGGKQGDTQAAGVSTGERANA